MYCTELFQHRKRWAAMVRRACGFSAVRKKRAGFEHPADTRRVSYSILLRLPCAMKFAESLVDFAFDLLGGVFLKSGEGRLS